MAPEDNPNDDQMRDDMNRKLYDLPTQVPDTPPLGPSDPSPSPSAELDALLEEASASPSAPVSPLPESESLPFAPKGYDPNVGERVYYVRDDREHVPAVIEGVGERIPARYPDLDLQVPAAGEEGVVETVRGVKFFDHTGGELRVGTWHFA